VASDLLIYLATTPSIPQNAALATDFEPRDRSTLRD